MAKPDPNYTMQNLIGAMKGSPMGRTQRNQYGSESDMVPSRTASGGRTSGTFATPSRTGFVGERGIGTSAVPGGTPGLQQPPGRQTTGRSASKIVQPGRSAFNPGMPSTRPGPSFGALSEPRGAVQIPSSQPDTGKPFRGVGQANPGRSQVPNGSPGRKLW
jgi:hypothetical protein